MRKIREIMSRALEITHECNYPKEATTIMKIAASLAIVVDELYLGKKYKHGSSPKFPIEKINNLLKKTLEENSDYVCISRVDWEELKNSIQYQTQIKPKMELKQLEAELWFTKFKLTENNMDMLTTKIKLYVVKFGKTEFIKEILNLYGFEIEEEPSREEEWDAKFLAMKIIEKELVKELA